MSVIPSNDTVTYKGSDSSTREAVGVVVLAGGLGGGAVTVADGADVAEGATTAAAYADTTGATASTVVGLLKGLYVAVRTATQRIGGVYRTAPTALADGDRPELLTDSRGNLRSRVQLSQWTAADGFANASVGRYDRFDQPESALVPASLGFVYNGVAWDRQRGDTNGLYGVSTGSSAAAVGIVPVVASGASSLVVKAAAGNFYGASIVAGAAAGFLIAYNAAAAPAAGATLVPGQILGVVAVSANGPAALGEYTVPDRFGTGIVLLFSTSTTTYTQPANPALFLRGRAM